MLTQYNFDYRSKSLEPAAATRDENPFYYLSALNDVQRRYTPEVILLTWGVVNRDTGQFHTPRRYWYISLKTILQGNKIN